VLPPASFLHEREKAEKRWPEAVRFIKERGLNEVMPGDLADIGIILQGGMYNGVIRALVSCGLADIYGNTRIPLYVMNVTYPLVDDELVGFCAAKRAVLLVEEGQPDYIEQALNSILRRADIHTKLAGKDVLPMGGEYTVAVLTKGIHSFLQLHAPEILAGSSAPPDAGPVLADPRVQALATTVPPRPPSFCTGCPERPIFSAMKLVQEELGQHHVAGDIGCHHHGLRARRVLRVGVPGWWRQAADRGDGRWRVLA
jgi:indolepyruvate ferredoxin oxidoreductase alpha subunit